MTPEFIQDVHDEARRFTQRLQRCPAPVRPVRPVRSPEPVPLVDYSAIPDSALLLLAKQILKRAHLSIEVATREKAISIIRSIKPAR